MPLRTLFVDFNSFFASAEQHLRPELRGRPVAVIPVMAETTCCIALSHEAKVRGLRGGMRVDAARRACPGIEIVEARPPLYVEIHHQLKAVIDACAPVEEVCSIDEMWCPLTRGLRERDAAIALAGRIKATIAREVGECLRCSIGIAPNVILAKIATDMQKPDGLVVIEERALPDALFPLTLRDLPGVGSRMEKRLLAAGIHSVEQLCQTPRALMRKIWGSVAGERMHDGLRGENLPVLQTQKSIVSHSHVLAPAQRHDEDAHAVLHRLLQKAATRLRRIGYMARGMQMFIEYAGIGGCSGALTFLETQDSVEFTRILNRLWDQRPLRPEPPLMIGVTLFDLVQQDNYTPSLFDGATTGKRQQLAKCIDQLNARFGKNTVYFGAAHTALDSAPMRIAFNFVPKE